MGFLPGNVQNWNQLNYALRIIDERLSEAQSLHGKLLSRGGLDKPSTSAVFGSGDSSSFTTTSTSYVNIPNLSVVITTTGRPIFVGFIHNSSGLGASGGIGVYDGIGAAQAQALIKIDRSGTPVSVHPINYYSDNAGEALQLPPSIVFTVDDAPRGTYTYTASAKVVTADDTFIAGYLKMFAIEL